jgi:hypothetical protein
MDAKQMGQLMRGILVWMVALCAACGGGESSAGAAAGGGDARLYVVADTVFSPEGDSTALCFLGSLKGDEAPDYSRCLEIFGRAVPYQSDGKLYVVGGEDATITRYEIGADRTFKKGDAISMQQLGVGSSDFAAISTIIIAPEKAYTFHSNGQQIIVWNPRALEIVKTVDISSLWRTDEGYSFNFESVIRRVRDGKLYVPFEYVNWDDASYPVDGGGVAIFNVATDSLDRVVVHDRCAGLTDSLMTGSGDLYFISSDLAGVRERMGLGDTRKPCIVRMRAGQDSFDPDYFVNPSTLTGGKITSQLIGGGGTSAYLRAYDEAYGAIDTTTVDTAWESFWTNEASSLWRINLETLQSQPVSTYPRSIWTYYDYEVDGTVVYVSVKPEYTDAQLWDMPPADGPLRIYQGRTDPYAILRVR